MKLRQYMAGQRYRKSLSRDRRLAIWKQCHGLCWYCGIKTCKSWFILDHVEPFSKGGADSKRNLVVACPPCDKEKGCMTLEEFRAHRGGITFFGEAKPKAKPMPAPIKVKPKPAQRQFLTYKIGEKVVHVDTVRKLIAMANGGNYIREPYRFENPGDWW